MAVFDPRNPITYGGTYTADASEASDPLVNTRAIQEAATAAHNAFLTDGSEQKLLLDDVFPITSAKKADNHTEEVMFLNQYIMRYAVNVRSGVNVEGSGGVKFLAAPVAINAGLNNFTAFVTGQLTAGSTPLAQMQKQRRVSFRGITVDTSALVWDDLWAMGEGSVAGAIAFGYTEEFAVIDCKIPVGWSRFTGAITAISGSGDGRIRRNTLGAIRKYNTPTCNAIRCDGATEMLVVGNTIEDGENILDLYTNHDNGKHPTGNIIRGNIIKGFHGTGITCHASDSIVADNEITGVAGKFITVTSSADSAHGSGFNSEGLLIARNKITATHVFATGSGVHLEGSALVRHLSVIGNEMNGLGYMVYRQNPLAFPSVFRNNYAKTRACANVTNDTFGDNSYLENTAALPPAA